MQNRVQAIQKKIAELKGLIAHLDQTIVDKDAKDFLLHSAKSSLSDVETYLLPQGLRARAAHNAGLWFRIVEFQLRWAERDLKHAENVVARYGPTVRVIG